MPKIMKLISKEKNQVRIGCLATQLKASLNFKSSKIIKQISMIEGLQSLHCIHNSENL